MVNDATIERWRHAVKILARHPARPLRDHVRQACDGASAGEAVFPTLDMIGIPGYRPASRIGSRALRAEILGKRHAGRLARGLSVRGHLDAQITHACFGISRQAVEYLLPTADQMQIGRVR
jgi:hypothetical protein